MFEQYFGEITDKRQTGKVKHNLVEIIVMTICAVIAGCEVWEDIADYCRVKEEWTNLRSFGMVISKVEQQGKITHDTRYFIASLEDIRAFSKAVRKHWGIENSLHWCLDMTFHEDYSRIRKDHSAENMAVVRHIALNILKNYPEKISL